jgi:hypothetical protein
MSFPKLVDSVVDVHVGEEEIQVEKQPRAINSVK